MCCYKVDMRYRSIEDPDLQTYVGLAGFYIATVSTLYFLNDYQYICSEYPGRG